MEGFRTRYLARSREASLYGKENLRVVQSRQKSYADHRRRELSFEVGDFVYLKVSPMRGLRHFLV
jgi:hypothetical protein